MEKYAKLSVDIVVPKVWLRAYDREHLERKTSRAIATHYLNLRDYPRRMVLEMEPRAGLVIVEEKCYFLLEEDCITFNVPRFEREKEREPDRHYREHQWLEISATWYPAIDSNVRATEGRFLNSTVSFIFFSCSNFSALFVFFNFYHFCFYVLEGWVC